jgi:tetratricopeptide (TPR) repeat protein
LQIRVPSIERLAPYLVLISLGLVFGLIIAFIRSCDASKIGVYPSWPQSSNSRSSLSDSSDYGQGSRAYFLGEYDAAILHFTAALDSHRPVGDVYNRRALAYDAKGEYEKALQDYEQALLAFDHALSPDSGPAMVHNNRACTYIVLGEYGKAMADLSEAIALQSTLGKAYYNRGLLHSSLGDYAAAIEDLSEALLHPASDSSWLLSPALAQEVEGVFGEMLEADEMERRFLETGADMPSALYQRAWAYRAQGQIDSALADLDRAIELLLVRKSRTMTLPLPTAFAPLRETPAAEAEENGVRDPRVDLPSVYHLRALLYAEKGDYDRAAADRDRALELGFEADGGQ